MKLFIETDLGHDPDDLFAILYLIAAGVEISGIAITPGSPDQLAICKFIKDECNQSFCITRTKDQDKLTSGSVHHYLLKKYKRNISEKPEITKEESLDILKDSDTLFVIGPPKLSSIDINNLSHLSKIVVQGGFLPYSLNPYENYVKLDKFEGLHTCPTFNLGGDKQGSHNLINCEIEGEKYFVGKNVCHTVLYDRDIHKWISDPKCRAEELFVEAMDFYLDNQTHKAFHDPLAACLLLHPEIGRWVNGIPFRDTGKYGTIIQGEDSPNYILADLDRNMFWDHITNFI